MMNIAQVVALTLIILLSGCSAIVSPVEEKTVILPKTEEIIDITTVANHGPVSIDEMKETLNAAKIIAESDPLLKDWHYTLPLMGTFRTKKGVYKFQLYGGGLGNLEGPDGKTTWFLSQHKD